MKEYQLKTHFVDGSNVETVCENTEGLYSIYKDLITVDILELNKITIFTKHIKYIEYGDELTDYIKKEQNDE